MQREERRERERERKGKASKKLVVVGVVKVW